LSSNAKLSEIKNNFTAKTEPKMDRKNLSDFDGKDNQDQFEKPLKD